MLPYQTPAWNFKPSSSFHERNVKMFASRTDILVKSVIFDNTPAGNGYRFLKNLISTIWDTFHGGAIPSYDTFCSVTDGQNANPYSLKKKSSE